MNALYYGACMAPFWMRIPGALASVIGSTINPAFLFIGFVPAVIVPYFALNALKRHRWI
jgi:hypothetical protein